MGTISLLPWGEAAENYFTIIVFSFDLIIKKSLMSQDQPFMVKNPKSESNSALVKKRRAKAGAPPTIQVVREERKRA